MLNATVEVDDRLTVYFFNDVIYPPADRNPRIGHHCSKLTGGLTLDKPNNYLLLHSYIFVSHKIIFYSEHTESDV